MEENINTTNNSKKIPTAKRMTAWVKGGLVGGGVGLIIYIIYLILSMLVYTDGHPPLIIFVMIPAILFQILFHYRTTVSIFILSVIVMGVLVILVAVLIGIFISLINPKRKQTNEKHGKNKIISITLWVGILASIVIFLIRRFI